MLILETIKNAFRSIWVNKFRSFLTILGIIIGIYSVIILVSAGKGVQQKVGEFINVLEPNTLIVLPIPSLGDDNPQFQQVGGLMSNISNNDVNALKQKVEHIKNINMIVMPSGIVKYNDKKAIPFISGASLDMNSIFKLEVENGRTITKDDEDKKNNVVVLGNGAKNTLELTTDDIGKIMTIGKTEFKIVGYFKKTNVQIFGFDLNNLYLMPYTSAQKLDDRKTLDRLFITANSKDNIEQVKNDIIQVFKDEHGDEDISVLEQKDALKLFDQVFGILTTLLSAIASISLIVGGIGIMNIMLVSVTERTHEIGIRKAIGANNSIILIQFLVEAIILTAIGTVIALTMVFISTYYINNILGDKAPINLVVDLDTIYLAVGISVIIGIVFGLFPAVIASKKNPIEALKYE